MTCRHKRICDVSNLLAGVWSTMRRRVDCWEVLPMGPARDEDLIEVWAAQYVRWGPAECMVPVEASDADWSTVLRLADAIREHEKD